MAGEKRLRILFITRCFPPATGGMERFAKDLSSAVSRKVDMTVLSWGGSKIALIAVLPYFFVRSFWLLARKEIDILHAQDGVVSIVLAPLAKVFKCPLIVVVHGLDVTYQSSLYQALIRRSLKHADTVIAISNSAKESVLKRGINSRKVQVIPLGITDDIFMDNKALARQQIENFTSLNPESKILLASGRLVERKGIDWFIAEVLPIVVKKQPGSILLVSGEGSWRRKIEMAIDTHQLKDHVQLLGRTTDTQLKYLYNASDCFVMPNVVVPGDMEGFGRVLLEAALCEVPVVASGIEGIVDAIIDNKNGRLVQPREAPEHARTILEILGNASKAKQFGRQARKYTLSNYNWTTLADRYVQVYEDAPSTNRQAS